MLFRWFQLQELDRGRFIEFQGNGAISDYSVSRSYG